MPFQMKNKLWQNIGVALEYDGQEKDIKALARKHRMSLGRLVLHSLQTLYQDELAHLRAERLKANGK